MSQAQLHLLLHSIPQAKVEALLEEHGVASTRERKLPADFLVYYLIAAGLYMQLSLRETLRTVLDTLLVRAGALAARLRADLPTPGCHQPSPHPAWQCDADRPLQATGPSLRDARDAGRVFQALALGDHRWHDARLARYPGEFSAL